MGSQIEKLSERLGAIESTLGSLAERDKEGQDHKNNSLVQMSQKIDRLVERVDRLDNHVSGYQPNFDGRGFRGRGTGRFHPRGAFGSQQSYPRGNFRAQEGNSFPTTHTDSRNSLN